MPIDAINQNALPLSGARWSAPSPRALKADSYGHSVPFGRHEDGALVDATQVPRGRACACRCPDCGTALIARQGDLKVWHFAHDQVAGCRNAGITALIQMTQQLLSGRTSLALGPVVLEGEWSHRSLGRISRRGTSAGPGEWRYTELQRIEPLPTPEGHDKATLVALSGPQGTLHVLLRASGRVEPFQLPDSSNFEGPEEVVLDLRPLVGRAFSRKDVERHLNASAQHTRWLRSGAHAPLAARIAEDVQAWVNARSVRAPALPSLPGNGVSSERTSHPNAQMVRPAHSNWHSPPEELSAEELLLREQRNARLRERHAPFKQLGEREKFQELRQEMRTLGIWDAAQDTLPVANTAIPLLDPMGLWRLDLLQQLWKRAWKTSSLELPRPDHLAIYLTMRYEVLQGYSMHDLTACVAAWLDELERANWLNRRGQSWFWSANRVPKPAPNSGA